MYMVYLETLSDWLVLLQLPVGKNVFQSTEGAGLTQEECMLHLYSCPQSELKI